MKISYPVIVKALATSVLISCCLPIASFAANRQVIWTCPKDETISFLRTSNTPGKLFVLTRKGGMFAHGKSWIVRSVSSGVVKILIKGPGEPLPLNTLIISDDEKRCLVGVEMPELVNGVPRRTVLDCDLITGKIHEDRSICAANTWGLWQPFSPDGRWLVLHGYKAAGKKLFLANIVDRAKNKSYPLKGAPMPVPRLPYFNLMWSQNGRLFLNCAGDLYTGDAKAVVFKRRYEPGVIDYVSPDGSMLTSVQKSGDGICIYRYNLLNNQRKVIYSNKSPEAGKASVIGIQYAKYSEETIVNTMWPRISPVYIDKRGHCKEIKIDKSMRWRLGCGVAIWKPGAAAVVQRFGAQGPDRIMAIPLQ